MPTSTPRPASKSNVVGIIVGAVVLIAALALLGWVGVQLLL